MWFPCGYIFTVWMSNKGYKYKSHNEYVLWIVLKKIVLTQLLYIDSQKVLISICFNIQIIQVNTTHESFPLRVHSNFIVSKLAFRWRALELKSFVKTFGLPVCSSPRLNRKRCQRNPLSWLSSSTQMCRMIRWPRRLSVCLSPTDSPVS